MEDGEELIGVWIGGRAWGNTNLTKIGGALYVTIQRLGLRTVGVPVETADGVSDLSGGHFSFEYPLREVLGAAVDPSRRAGITIHTSSDDIRLNISHKPLATVFSRKNKAALDEAVAAITLAKRGG